ncbi:hypothetical protein P8625_04285 [Tenacibaculum tangerinum]|uniref:DUF695 domain-containing protein n=1 Tax=Tenacibaculum tangerinum TaxID=3038772 RepID=A0ABY8L8R3_9FLAO|nr:hypothetical protein [Tenacibaculum tangerinum]WGH76385.1 hypothetical protein P8625_04285 [Tenacibaculum tangerinum]
MNRKTFILLTLTIFTSFGYSQSEKIKIRTNHLNEGNYLKIDDFYLTHYLYIDLFLRENLFPEASPQDVSAVLKAIKKYVSVENKLDIEIEKPGKRNYLIRMAILKKDDGTELLIAFTNWSVKKRMFEKEIKLENNSYARWYFLNENKMTYRKDMSNQNDYSNMTDSDLANAFLFDEQLDNDIKIQSTINKTLNNNDISVSENIKTNLILLKYHLFKRDTENISKQTEYLNTLFKNNESKHNLRGLKMAFDATKFQIELMK